MASASRSQCSRAGSAGGWIPRDSLRCGRYSGAAQTAETAVLMPHGSALHGAAQRCFAARQRKRAFPAARRCSRPPAARRYQDVISMMSELALLPRKASISFFRASTPAPPLPVTMPGLAVRGGVNLGAGAGCQMRNAGHGELFPSASCGDCNPSVRLLGKSCCQRCHLVLQSRITPTRAPWGLTF